MPTDPSEAPARRPAKRSQAARNARVGLICGAVFFGMVGAAFAAVPLYRAFCQLTGFDGTVRRAEAKPGTVLDRTVAVRFDTNVRDLPWSFRAEQVSQTVKIGDTGLAFFKVTNNAKAPVTGRAAYNVVPEGAGPYFQKLECFCFTEQTIQPGQTIVFPVVYFVDPRFADDINTRGAQEITLSYTFYPQEAGAAAVASAPKTPQGLGAQPSAGL